jgi:hypothetical protein
MIIAQYGKTLIYPVREDDRRFTAKDGNLSARKDYHISTWENNHLSAREDGDLSALEDDYLSPLEENDLSQANISVHGKKMSLHFGR